MSVITNTEHSFFLKLQLACTTKLLSHIHETLRLASLLPSFPLRHNVMICTSPWKGVYLKWKYKPKIFMNFSEFWEATPKEPQVRKTTITQSDQTFWLAFVTPSALLLTQWHRRTEIALCKLTLTQQSRLEKKQSPTNCARDSPISQSLNTD